MRIALLLLLSTLLGLASVNLVIAQDDFYLPSKSAPHVSKESAYFYHSGHHSPSEPAASNQDNVTDFNPAALRRNTKNELGRRIQLQPIADLNPPPNVHLDSIPRASELVELNATSELVDPGLNSPVIPQPSRMKLADSPMEPVRVAPAPEYAEFQAVPSVTENNQDDYYLPANPAPVFLDATSQASGMPAVPAEAAVEKSRPYRRSKCCDEWAEFCPCKDLSFDCPCYGLTSITSVDRYASNCNCAGKKRKHRGFGPNRPGRQGCSCTKHGCRRAGPPSSCDRCDVTQQDVTHKGHRLGREIKRRVAEIADHLR